MLACFLLTSVDSFFTVPEREKWKAIGLEVFVLNFGRNKQPGLQHWMSSGNFSCNLSVRSNTENVLSSLLHSFVFVTFTKPKEQGNRSSLSVPILQPCINVWISFFFGFHFWARLYITATEALPVLSFWISNASHSMCYLSAVYWYRKPLQPVLRTPITPGALSLICIYVAFQKMPNLFSFTLNPASRHHFSLFDSTSLSPPSKKKPWLPTFLSCLANTCVPWQEAYCVPHHWPVHFSCLVCLFLLALTPVIPVVEELCTVVLNFPVQILWIISIGKQQERTWRHGVLLDTWLLFKKEIKREKLRKEWCGANLQDMIIYMSLSGRPALCVYRINWMGQSSGEVGMCFCAEAVNWNPRASWHP